MAAVPPPPGTAAAGATTAAAATPPPSKPLQKPPGYRDPSAPATPSGPPRRTPAPAGRLNRPIPPPPGSFNRAATNGAANGKPEHYNRGRTPTRRGAGGGGGGGGRYSRRRQCCTRRRCCCCVLAVVLLVILALALAGGVAYLLLQPRAPAFHLQTLRVPLLRVSVRPDGTFLDANASAAVLAANPNGKLGLVYKGGRVRISAEDDEGDVAIGDPEPFAGFVQSAGNSTVLRAAARVKGAVVGDAVGSRLRARFQTGDLRFVVEVRTRVALKVRGGERVDVPVKVRCGGVTLKQVGGGGRADARNKCSINLLRWINL